MHEVECLPSISHPPRGGRWVTTPTPADIALSRSRRLEPSNGGKAAAPRLLRLHRAHRGPSGLQWALYDDSRCRRNKISPPPRFGMRMHVRARI